MIYLLGKDDPFPPIEEALEEPNGLLAVGGDLSPQRLLYAYRLGIFPWFNPGDPILSVVPKPQNGIALRRPQDFQELKKEPRESETLKFVLILLSGKSWKTAPCPARTKTAPGLALP